MRKNNLMFLFFIFYFLFLFFIFYFLFFIFYFLFFIFYFLFFIFYFLFFIFYFLFFIFYFLFFYFFILRMVSRYVFAKKRNSSNTREGGPFSLREKKIKNQSLSVFLSFFSLLIFRSFS